MLADAPPAGGAGWAPLTWQERVWVLFGAMSGLAYLHTPDPDTHKPTILHRDIKPSNILLDTDLQPRLADMGLAREQGAAGQNVTTSVAGTNGFMDYYYQDTGRFDVSCDAYAMGVVILMVLTKFPAVDAVEGHIIGQCEVEEHDLMTITDQSAQWPREVAKEVHAVGMALVKRNRRNRITVHEARQRFERIFDQVPADPAAADIAERECIMCMSAPRHVRFNWSVLLVLCTRILTYCLPFLCMMAPDLFFMRHSHLENLTVGTRRCVGAARWSL